MSNLNLRMSQLHLPEDSWRDKWEFIPNLGEIIVYDPDDQYDYPRFKIGNGVDSPNNLPFFSIDPIANWDIKNWNNENYYIGCVDGGKISDYPKKETSPEEPTPENL